MSSLQSFDAENADNLEDIEKQFAVKAVQQAEVYWKLLQAVKGSRLRLTKYDNEIYEDLVEAFPEFKDKEFAAHINEDELKNHKNKNRWRDFSKKWEEKIEDYNFGTLLRTNASGEYDQDNTIFAVRLQFYCYEICRNRYGLNDWVNATK